MTEPSTRLAIFDLGNVVFRCDHMATYRVWARHTGGEEGDIDARHPMNPAWEAFERGDIDGEEYWRYVKDELGLRLAWDQFVEGWNAIYFEVFAEVVAALKRLGQKTAIVALTNTNAVHCQAWQPKYADTLDLFRRVYVSSEMGLRKPQRAIYEAVLEQESTAAADALFFDDNAANVAGATAVGIDSVLVESPHSVIDALAERQLL